MYIIQAQLFDFEAFIAKKENDRLVMVLEALPAGGLISALEKERWTGRKGYSVRGMCSALIAGILRQAHSLADVVRLLERDKDARMVFWGRDGNYLKYRCPEAVGKGVCKSRFKCTSSPYGYVLKLPINDDPRRHPPVPRESKKWQRLYRLRTAIKRVNSRVKGLLGLGTITLRGIGKVTVRAMLSLLVMLAAGVGMTRRHRLSELRIIVTQPTWTTPPNPFARGHYTPEGGKGLGKPPENLLKGFFLYQNAPTGSSPPPFPKSHRNFPSKRPRFAGAH